MKTGYTKSKHEPINLQEYAMLKNIALTSSVFKLTLANAIHLQIVRDNRKSKKIEKVLSNTCKSVKKDIEITNP